MRAPTSDCEASAHQLGGYYLIGVDDGTLGEIDHIADRLQVSGEWIKSDTTMTVKQ